MPNILIYVVYVNYHFCGSIRVFHHFVGDFLSNLIDILFQRSDSCLSAVVLDYVVFDLVCDFERELRVKDSGVLDCLRH